MVPGLPRVVPERSPSPSSRRAAGGRWAGICAGGTEARGTAARDARRLGAGAGSGVRSLPNRDHDPEHGQEHDDAEDPSLEVDRADFLPSELELEVVGQPVGKVRDVVRRRLLEELLHRPLPVEQHFGMGEQVRKGVGQGKGIGQALLAEPFDLGPETLLRRVRRGREVQVHLLHEARDGPGQRLVLRVPGELRDAGGGKGKVAGRIAYHREAGLEALDSFFLGVDGVQVDPKIARDPLRQIGNVPHGAGQLVLEALDARERRRSARRSPRTGRP